MATVTAALGFYPPQTVSARQPQIVDRVWRQRDHRRVGLPRNLTGSECQRAQQIVSGLWRKGSAVGLNQVKPRWDGLEVR